MQKDLKIAIYGAGAIGCVVAARLILAGYSAVSLIARGQNKQVLEAHGIRLKDLTGEYQVYPFQVVECPSVLEVQDYIFICTKFDALTQISKHLHTMLHPQTVVIPLINGVPFWYFYQDTSTQINHIKTLDPDGELIKTFPLAHLIGAVVFITAQLEAYGQVSSHNPYLLILGEPNQQMSERLAQLSQLFIASGIEVRQSTDIRDQIWTKVMANLSSNPLSVIASATLSDIYAHPYLRDIALNITQEVRQVAASYGARIKIDPCTFLSLGADMGPIYTSMWYDYQKKNPLELTNIIDAVLELAAVYAVPMPTTKLIAQLTRYLNQKNIQT
ncbi:2-dehydropantoate 2-reductase [Acinetobacter sp. SAAs474]|uniref:ketopantoate reductase family protein n=2 Tax=unclassified Acinetobacter TaxID=196816 RepID=UPI0029344CFE|nr:2-dehydropantoate 2-reductase [Acinetobacter sp. SAAs474]